MELLKILQQQRKSIVKKWYDLVIYTYPSETVKFLVSTKDPFANPVGSNLREGLNGLYDELLNQELDQEKVISFLDPIIRIRAVQNFSHIQAVEFVFWVKNIIRDALKKESQTVDLLKELLAFELRIDTIGMLAFTVYTQCKETLYSIRANQGITKAYKTFKRAGLLKEFDDENYPSTQG